MLFLLTDVIFIRKKKMVCKVDPAWKHDVNVDGKKSRTRCNYCDKVIISGIIRLKQHLAHREGQVSK